MVVAEDTPTNPHGGVPLAKPDVPWMTGTVVRRGTGTTGEWYRVSLSSAIDAQSNSSFFFSQTHRVKEEDSSRSSSLSVVQTFSHHWYPLSQAMRPPNTIHTTGNGTGFWIDPRSHPPTQPRNHALTFSLLAQSTRSGVSDFYQGLPVVSRTLLTCYLITGLTWFLNVLPVHLMYHAWPLDLFSFPPFAATASVPGIHRLILNFTVIGRPSINYLFNLVWLIQYGVSYEKAAFFGDATAAIWGTMLGMASILVVDLLLPPFSGPFHGQALIFQMLYLWSKTQGPEVNVRLFGVVNLKALYLPFALLFVDIIQGANPAHGIRGILAGHLYWFLKQVVQVRWVGEVPAWLRRARWVDALDNFGKGKKGAARSSGTQGAAAQGTKPSTSSAGFKAFSGRGHKLS